MRPPNTPGPRPPDPENARAPSALRAISIPNVEGWTERITATLSRSVQSIIEVGQILIDAKNELGRGEFGDWVNTKLPFDCRTAQRFMAIAKDTRLADATRVSHLPPSWGTLHAMTRLDDDQFKDAEDKGLIRTDVTRQKITALARAKKPGEPEVEDRRRQGGEPTNLIDYRVIKYIEAALLLIKKRRAANGKDLRARLERALACLRGEEGKR